MKMVIALLKLLKNAVHMKADSMQNLDAAKLREWLEDKIKKRSALVSIENSDFLSKDNNIDIVLKTLSKTQIDALRCVCIGSFLGLLEKLDAGDFDAKD
jgi:hypothetical protein